MTSFMYQASVPVFVRALHQLRHVLEKGHGHALERGIDPSILLGLRLVPDMFPLLRQVQIATDMAKNGAARMAGVEPLKFVDDETSFEALFARIDQAVAYLESFQPAQFEGSESRTAVVPTRSRGELRFHGIDYLNAWVLPNLFFHTTTTYNLLRQAGVALGKADFLGPAGEA